MMLGGNCTTPERSPEEAFSEYLKGCGGLYSMKDFLESNGYKMWKQEENTLHFQKRVDDIYPESPVCECNEKLFINIQVFTFSINGMVRRSCEMNMVHERPDDEWCDLKIYSLTQDQVKSNLTSYEDKMIMLWEVFYD